MSKPVSKTLIGVFVMGAMALAVTAVLVFGSGRFFKQTKKFVMVFPGSVKGLNVGAPVIFRGVAIGQVTDIQLRVDPKTLSGEVPVYVEIDPDKFSVPQDQRPLLEITRTKYAYINPLIDKGLKAQLQLQSFVTGQSMVYLDFFPDKPVRLTGIEKRYPEIPTVPGDMEELSKTLKDLKLGELLKNITHVVDSLDKIANSPELKGSIASLHDTLKDTDRLVKNVDSQVKPVMADLKETLGASRTALAQAERTLAQVEKALSSKDGVPAEVNKALQTASEALRQAESTLKAVQAVAEDNANTGHELNRTLKDVSAAARSVNTLADYLERHPESMLQGKPGSKGE